MLARRDRLDHGPVQASRVETNSNRTSLPVQPNATVMTRGATRSLRSHARVRRSLRRHAPRDDGGHAARDDERGGSFPVSTTGKYYYVETMIEPNRSPRC